MVEQPPPALPPADAEGRPVRYREVPGLERVFVGDDGSVWTCRRAGPPRRLAGRLAPDGKLTVRVELRRDGGRPAARVLRPHLLVLQAFAGPRPPGAVGDQADGDPFNCRLENLLWRPRRTAFRPAPPADTGNPRLDALLARRVGFGAPGRMVSRARALMAREEVLRLLREAPARQADLFCASAGLPPPRPGAVPVLYLSAGVREAGIANGLSGPESVNHVTRAGLDLLEAEGLVEVWRSVEPRPKARWAWLRPGARPACRCPHCGAELDPDALEGD